MTILEAKKYLEENPLHVLISPTGHHFDRVTWNAIGRWAPEYVFGEWKVKREPMVVWMNEFHNGTCCYHPTKEVADHYAGNSRYRLVKFVEVLDETT